MSNAPSEQRLNPNRAMVWVLLPLLGFWLYGLFDLDEGFYAAVVAEMNRRHDWVTPWYNGKPWFEKPVLLYWLAKPTVQLFGEQWGPRLPSVLATLGLAYLLGKETARRYTEKAGFWVTVAFGTSLLTVALGRQMMTDMPLALALAGCFLLFYRSLEGRPNLRIAAAACLGAAVLAKGPVAGAFFVLLAGWTFWKEPGLRKGFRGGWLLSILAFVAVVALWYVPAWYVHRDVFVQKFLIEQNLGRFQGGDEAHKVDFLPGLVYFIPILFLGMLPWSLWVAKAWPLRSRLEDPFLRFCAAWAAIVFVFFTASMTKLPHYILPAVPALAVLVGVWLGRQDRTARWAGVTSVVVFAVANLGFLGWYHGWFGGAAPHADVHKLTQVAKGLGRPVVAYRLGKQKSDRTVGLKVRESEHPSIIFYLNSSVIQTSDFEEMLAQGYAAVLTRPGRIQAPDVEEAARRDLELKKQEGTAYYQLWTLSPHSLSGLPKGEE